MVIYFWRDITRIISTWFKSLLRKVPLSDPDARLGWWIIVGTLPIVVLGLIFQDAIETTLRSLWFVAGTLIIFGILLGIADKLGSHTRTLDHLTWKQGLVFGFAQALALIPGVSRSGGTITAGLLMGYKREDAARYSFLLAIPAVLGSGMLQLVKSLDSAGTQAAGAAPSWLMIIIATVVAFVVALGVIAFLMRWLTKHSFLPFVLYRVALGVFVIVMLMTGVLEPYGGA